MRATTVRVARRRRGIVAVVLLAAAASGLTAAGVDAAADDVGAYVSTQTLDRTVTDGDRTTTVDSRDVTVKVDHTKNLRGRERVDISWSGAHPSGGRAVNPFGENGLDQEYPVVILQCRGRDDSSLPAAQRLRPETCFTSTFNQRSQRAVPDGAAIWRADSAATERDRGPLSGVDSLPEKCEKTADGFSDHLTTFAAPGGKTFAACSADTMPPEASVDASYPAAEQAAYTGTDGTGSTKFEVRSSTESESLGCTDSVACSIVVIPIMGLSCAQTASRQLNAACRATGRFEPGSSNFDGQGVDDAVSARYWWSASNWRHRFSVPITFGPPPDVCDVTDPRAPVGFFGSELMRQAGLQWAPAYCGRKDRFRFQQNVLPDRAAYALVQEGEIPGAFVSGAKGESGDRPTEYAPTAVSGYAISYVIDRPDNAGSFTQLRLDARLLAKLLTQSYPGSSIGQQHPGLGDNPLSINLDPEFIALNPGLDRREREAAAVVMNLSEESDVITALTDYIATDPEASAFLDGKADPWGMTINPSYKGIDVPRSDWPLLDEFLPEVSQACLKANNTVPYLSRLAAPVTQFSRIAEALLDAWPLAQTRCTGDGSDKLPFVLGRGERQGVGARFLLGITTLGDAERLGLSTAALQTTRVQPKGTFTSSTGRTFVGPTQASMAAAIGTATAGDRGEPFTLDQARLRGARGAYPGTLVVYTAARTSGLDEKTAGTVAQFIRIATTEGQRPGSGNGFLPDGYLPIRRTGVTGPLFASAQQVASDVAGQVGDRDRQDDDGGADPGSGGGTDGAVDLGGAPDSDDASTPDATPKAQDDQLQSLGETADAGAGLGGWMFLILLVLGLGCGLAAPLLRVLAARKVQS